ncbi:chemotaxis protein, partial [Rhizobium johnstonii]
KIDALSRAPAIIEFTPAGAILTATDNFLSTLGSSLAEIQGKHHSMFCEAAYSRSESYKEFWRRLASGQLVADKSMRV